MKCQFSYFLKMLANKNTILVVPPQYFNKVPLPWLWINLLVCSTYFHVSNFVINFHFYYGVFMLMENTSCIHTYRHRYPHSDNNHNSNKKWTLLLLYLFCLTIHSIFYLLTIFINITVNLFKLITYQRKNVLIFIIVNILYTSWNNYILGCFNQQGSFAFLWVFSF
jgi:hypothetical protein